MVHLNNSSTAIHGVLIGNEIICDTLLSRTTGMCLTEIDSWGRLNLCHNYDALLTTKLEVYIVVHDELVSNITTKNHKCRKFYRCWVN